MCSQYLKPYRLGFNVFQTSRRLLGLNQNNVTCLGLGGKKYFESSYQSAISLRTLYPTSSLHLSTPKFKVPENSVGKFSGYIPIEGLNITYSRSSGPGGQNVNCVNTKVDVRFHVETAEWLAQDTRSRIADIFKTKISKEGFLIVRSDKTRSQQLNLADCMEILRSMIRQAEHRPAAPPPETQEQLRKRRERANQLRLIEKKSRSLIKAGRQAPPLL